MKSIRYLLPLLALFACKNAIVTEELKNNNLVLAEDVQTILPMEKDTSQNWDCADFTNASSKLDQEKIFLFITKGVLSGKFKAYKDYPNKELSIADVDHILVRWDTIQVEDPKNPGAFVTAPIKEEIPAWTVAKINFHETIEVDTVTNTIHSEIAYISLFIFKKNEIGETIGTKKLFDVKLNKEKN